MDGTGLWMNNYYYRCWRDVYCKGSQNSDIKYNISQFSKLKSIEVQSAFGNRCNISQNAISNTKFGIHCNANISTSTEIWENSIITRRVHTDIGIRLNDALFLSGWTSIHNNAVSTYGTYGIHVLNNNYGHVSSNYVRVLIPYLLSLQTPFYGIRNDNCFSDIISCNTVDGISWGLSYNRNAITTSFSSIGQVSCNTTGNTQRGFQFLGSCDPTLFFGNHLFDHYDGLVLGKVGITSGEFGPQTIVANSNLPGNEYWGGDGAGTFGEYATLSINSNLLNYPFWTKSGIYHPSPNHLYGGNGYLISPSDQQNIDPFDCDANPPYCPPPPPIPASALVVDTTEASTPNREVMKMEHEKNLSTFLLLNSAYRDSSEELENFADSISGTNAGGFALVNYTVLSSDTDSLGYIPDSLKLHVAIASDLNEAIDPTTEYEGILRTINSIKLKSVGDGRFALTQEEVEALLAVAYLCPFTFGPAVYDARGLLTLINPAFNVDDEDVCEVESEERRASPNLISQPSQQAYLFPNPASSEINISLLHSENDNAVFEIYNFSGQSIIKGSVQSKAKIRIDVSAIPSGIYYIRLIINGSLVLSTKFAIIK